MLDSAEISVNSLLIWTGYALGGTLLVLRATTGTVSFAAFGLALIVISSAWALRGWMVAREAALLAAFEHGRDYERTHDLKAVR